jgi:hypothetical protein
MISSNKKAFQLEGLPSFYIVTYITLQTSLRNVSLCALYASLLSCWRKNRLASCLHQIIVTPFYKNDLVH